MAELTATFETGVEAATITTGDAGSLTPWDSVNGSPVYNNAIARGNFSMLTDGDGEYCTWSTALGTVTDYYGRVYIYLTANPSGGSAVFQIVRPYDTIELCASVVYVNSTGKLVIGDIDSSLGTSTNSVALNQWVRIEFHVIHSTTVGFIEVKLFNDADSVTATETLTSSANNNTRASANNVRIGRDIGGAAGNVWIDNVVFNATSYPGPFGGMEPQVLSMQAHVFGHGVW